MDKSSGKPVAVVTGVGPGLGAALVRRFAPTYAVAMLARKADYLKSLAAELRAGGATVLDRSCDISDRAQIAAAFTAIRKELGDPEVLLYNAGTGAFGTITDITPEQYEADWRVNAFGAFVAAKEVAPAMIARGRGTMLFTGATASVRGGAGFSAFAGAKHALRALAQSLARELGPKGVHVAHVVIDGAIDGAFIRGLMPDAAEKLAREEILVPDEIAKNYVWLYRQKRSAWTFEMDLRPWSETW